MQMIGRGLRGLDAGGTRYANIVDFHDTWDKFNFWLDPKKLLIDEFEEIIQIDEEPNGVIGKILQEENLPGEKETEKYDPLKLWDIYIKIYSAVDVVKYLIYHEMLHANGYWNHNEDFRSYEWNYPKSEEWDGFLDQMSEKFKLDFVFSLKEKKTTKCERNSKNFNDKENMFQFKVERKYAGGR
jgi:superfamily II DNA or RNA helicase